MNFCICGRHFWHVDFLGGKLQCVWDLLHSCFGQCMPYDIRSIPCLIWCTSRLLHVVPVMLYNLAYCGLLILSLVGLVLCGCSQILQTCECNIIGGNELSYALTDLDTLLSDVVIYPTIGGRSLYLRFIVALWNGFWTYGCLYVHCFTCDYLGKPIGTWCPWC